MTAADATKLKKELKAKEVEVRAFLGTDFDYFNAFEERALVIAEANTPADKEGNFLDTRVGARASNEPTISHVRQVTHIDVSPKQIMSISTSLIPFLEHDDATRAEMGTNMMRQAVPLLKTDSPVVGT